MMNMEREESPKEKIAQSIFSWSWYLKDTGLSRGNLGELSHCGHVFYVR